MPIGVVCKWCKKKKAQSDTIPTKQEHPKKIAVCDQTLVKHL